MSICLEKSLEKQLETYKGTKEYLQNSVGQVLKIRERRIWGNEIEYVKPKNYLIIDYTDKYIIANSDKGYKACFNYADFYCRDKTFEVVDVYGKR